MTIHAPITIDGSQGEGGGQILRSSLTLSLATGRPVRLTGIRSRRVRPGLARQHLTAVAAAAAVGEARVTGAEPGSTELSFAPGRIQPGTYRFAVGTAGSATLVLQTILPVLLTAAGHSRVVVEGGTHNMAAPPFDYLDQVYLPVINGMGPRVEVRLDRYGFFPAGGGRITATVEPVGGLKRIEIMEKGETRSREIRAVVAHLPRGIAEREVLAVRKQLAWENARVTIEAVDDSSGPGNIVLLTLRSAHVTEVTSGFGRRGVPADRVAGEAAGQMRRYLASEAPVGRHLADQLMVPLAIGGGGRFRTSALTRHAWTQIDLIRRFLETDVAAREIAADMWEIEIGGGQ